MRKRRTYFLTFILILCLLLSGCGTPAPVSDQNSTGSVTANPQSFADIEKDTDSGEGSAPQTTLSETSAPAVSGDPTTEQLSVHFIDVGQGDSILIQAGDENMLIDAGTNESGSVVTQYLTDLGISHLDWVIGTHPHEDHIGGLDDVILSTDVDRVMMPPKEHTTQTFEDVLDAVEAKNLTITVPETGDTYPLGDGRFTVLGPVADYGDDLNNWSIVLRLDYGDTSFLFTGDVESTAESDILNSGLSVDADVLKVGHHGSDTSTSQDFLDAVSPDFAVISAGKGNDYGHPHQATLNKLLAAQVNLCRTDLQGTVIITSNGSDLDVSYEKEAGESELGTSPDASASEIEAGPAVTSETQQTQTADPDISIQVHITRTGEKYHSAGCQYLKNSDIPISLADAKAQGYTPCSKCHPPQ